MILNQHLLLPGPSLLFSQLCTLGGEDLCCLSHADALALQMLLFRPFIARDIGGPRAGELVLTVPTLTNDVLSVQPTRGQTRAVVQGLDVAPLLLNAG